MPLKHVLACCTLLGLLLTGCGQYHWVNAAAPNANFNQDLDQCTQRFDASMQASSQPSGINQSPNVPTNPVMSPGVINDQYIPPINAGCDGGAGMFGCSGYPASADSIDTCLMSRGWRQRRN